MTIITEEIIEEAVAETIKEAIEPGGRAAAETVEEIPGETVEEMIEETMEETTTRAKRATAAGTKRRRRFRPDVRSLKPRRIFDTRLERAQLKRLAGWLAPYLAALLLVMLIGGVILLVTGMKTSRLSRQIQEQYGEYFTDGQ